MPVPVIAAGLGLAGNFIASSQAQSAASAQAQAIQDAANRRATQDRALAAPYLAAGTQGLQGLESAVSGPLADAATGFNPVLSAQHQLDQQNIQAQKASELAQAQEFFGGTGNSGRARGDALRIDQASTEASNAENLNYASNVQNYKQDAIGRFVSGLSSLASAGNVGMNLASGANAAQENGAVGAAGATANGAFGAAQDIGGLSGMLFNYGANGLVPKPVGNLNLAANSGSGYTTNQYGQLVDAQGRVVNNYDKNGNPTVKLTP